MAAKKKKPTTPPEKVYDCGIDRDDDKYLYYVDKRCNIIRMQRGVAKASTEILVKTGLKREKGWMYYLDDGGDLVREPDKSRDG